jgi:hypothetical protein
MARANRSSPVQPPGEGKSIKGRLLEKGADWLQDATPMKQFDAYVVGFHCAKHDPSLQMEAHHYCHLVNDEFLQCVVFDGNTEEANLIGVEYILSERLFDTLPTEEKSYWHPHNYEIMSGELIAPGLPDAAEKELMKMLVNSYGKTWHTWHSGRHDQGPGDSLPLGDPHLMWSFNREGEADESMKRDRDTAMQLDPKRKQRERLDLTRHAHPQCGVDTLKDAFPDAKETPPPGVRESGACSET